MCVCICMCKYVYTYINRFRKCSTFGRHFPYFHIESVEYILILCYIIKNFPFLWFVFEKKKKERERIKTWPNGTMWLSNYKFQKLFSKNVNFIAIFKRILGHKITMKKIENMIRNQIFERQKRFVFHSKKKIFLYRCNKSVMRNFYLNFFNTLKY